MIAQEKATEPRFAPPRPPWRGGAIAIAVAIAVAAGAAGFAVGHHGAQGPTGVAVTADRAIAMVVGEQRPTDHMTLDAWYRTRMSHLAPGIDIQYVALRSGSTACGNWTIDAIAVPGPMHGSRAGLAALNEYGPIGSVDMTSGQIAGLDAHSVAVTVYDLRTNCAAQEPDSGHTWLDEFRNGAPAWPPGS